jgi:hypothetical protein
LYIKIIQNVWANFVQLFLKEKESDSSFVGMTKKSNTFNINLRIKANSPAPNSALAIYTLLFKKEIAEFSACKYVRSARAPYYRKKCCNLTTVAVRGPGRAAELCAVLEYLASPFVQDKKWKRLFEP